VSAEFVILAQFLGLVVFTSVASRSNDPTRWKCAAASPAWLKAFSGVPIFSFRYGLATKNGNAIRIKQRKKEGLVQRNSECAADSHRKRPKDASPRQHQGQTEAKFGFEGD
jgi:hypothetical protein